MDHIHALGCKLSNLLLVHPLHLAKLLLSPGTDPNADLDEAE